MNNSVLFPENFVLNICFSIIKLCNMVLINRYIKVNDEIYTNHQDNIGEDICRDVGNQLSFMAFLCSQLSEK